MAKNKRSDAAQGTGNTSGAQEESSEDQGLPAESVLEEVPPAAPPALEGIGSGEIVGTPTIIQGPPAGTVGGLDAIEAAKGAAGTPPGPSEALAGAEEPSLPPPVEAKPAPRYRVGNKVTSAWKTIEVRLNPGDVVTEDSYGEGAIEHFKRNGVQLTELTEQE